MTISIFSPRRSGVPQFATAFALNQDNWNDYSFHTLYHLYRRQTDTDSSPSMIGSVKILKRGQAESDGIQINRPFEALDSKYCSVGTSLDYYQRLNEISPDERTEILLALRDVVYQPELQAEFRDEEGWSISLFRDNPDFDEFLSDALAILTGDFTALADIDQPISFLPTNWSTPLELDFDAPEPLFPVGSPTGHGPLLPRRINVVIGRNGSGKSTLLSRIAHVAFASPTDRSRPEIQNIGVMKPNTTGFIKIIAISYSPFDNFVVPGFFESDRRQIADDIKKGTGRYVYAGIRDIAAEALDKLDTEYPEDELVQTTVQDRRTVTQLKSLDQLASEFERLIDQIQRNNDNLLLRLALKPLLSDASFADLQSKEPSDLLSLDVRNTFLSWSTGHKIVLHIVASLVAHTTRRSLVLFDEPEMHLHPPFIAALMRSFRIILERRNAFAVIATHSPVVLQETLARHVHIVRRTGSDFRILKSQRETFGENVGILTYDAFGLTGDATDFHEILDVLVEICDDVSEISELFNTRLSGQALSYVMAGLARKAKQ